jgi:hypothetical protein
MGGGVSSQAGNGSGSIDAAVDGATVPESDAAPDGGKADAAPDGGGPLVCPDGFLNCNGDVEDGCEAEIATDIDHCGACNDPCSSDGVATRSRVDGECRPACDGTHGNCNDDGRDGCEVDLKSDVDHCNACDSTCSSTGVATRRCANGTCDPVCSANRGSCDGNGKNGCETNLNTNAGHCGACNYACSTAGATGATVCAAGVCRPNCDATHGDCDTPARPTADNGCETSLTTSTDCGACGHDCLGGACAGAAQQCLPVNIVGSVYPNGIAVDDLYVFITEGCTGGRVMRRSQNGGASGALTLASSQDCPQGIVTFGGDVYWTNGLFTTGGVYKVGRAGGAPQPLYTASGATGPGPLTTAVNPTDGKRYLFWAGNKVRHMYRTDPTLSGPTNASRLQPSADTFIVTAWDVVSDGTFVYVAADQIGRTPWGGQDQYVVLEPAYPTTATRLVIDATWIYYASQTELNRLEKYTGGDINEGQIPDTSGLDPELILTAGSTIRALAISGNTLFFATNAGVYRSGKNPGATAVPLYTANMVGDMRMVVTNEAIYWYHDGGNLSTPQGAVYKLAR